MNARKNNRFAPSLSGVLLIVSGMVLMAPDVAFSASQDCNIWWSEVLHDSFNATYRSPLGAVTPGTTVRLRLRVAQSDLTGVRVRVWNDRTNTETYYSMAWDGAFDTDPTTYDWYALDLPVGASPTILYYFFELNDAPGWCSADQDFYVDDDPRFYGGGSGAVSDGYDGSRNYQITVYDPAFSVPEWMQRGVAYQILPDRFRDGNAANDPPAGRFHYGAYSSIVRSGAANNPNGYWNSTVCDPRGLGAVNCPNRWMDNFYGGDLGGIMEKIDAGYFDTLGVTVLCLNPIFRSPSYSKYETSNYFQIDADFGDLAALQALKVKAEAHGIKLILDGAFNYTSSDSAYFDFYCRWNGAGDPTAPGEACSTQNDGSGACESASSSYRNLYYLPDIGYPAEGGMARCGGTTYEAWYGYGSLPRLATGQAGVRSLIYANGLDSVGPYWTLQGADGWRLGLGGDADPGLTNDPGNLFWEGFRTAVRNAGVTTKSDVMMVGEEWGDASAWLLGNEWDSATNVRLRSAALCWLFTGCSGNGCTGGASFQDNDNNASSPGGAISGISATQFDARLRSIGEDYPPMAFKAMMNIEGTHDTGRLRYVLKKINNDSDAAARQRMKEYWIFAFTYPGVPTLYYGDEIGLTADGVWDGSSWQDDPYNRAPFPWDDAGGAAYAADTADLLPHARRMASIRHAYRALQDGDVQHGLIVDDTNKLYGFARTSAAGTALVGLNRNTASRTLTFGNLNGAPYNLGNGIVLVDALNGGTYAVFGGQVSVPVAANWGAVLVEQGRVDTPAPAGGLDIEASGNNWTLSWKPVIRDSGGGHETNLSYEVHRSTTHDFTPSAGTLRSTITPAPFGLDGGSFTYTDPQAEAGALFHYRIRAFNAPGAYSDSACFSPEVCDSVDNDSDSVVDDDPLPPGPVGDSLQITKAGTMLALDWGDASRAMTYGVYQSASASGMVVPGNRIAEVIPSEKQLAPPKGDLYFYMITSRDTCGAEVAD